MRVFVILSLFFNGCQRDVSAVSLIVHQPQIQLIQFGAEQRVHVLRAEGRFVFGEAASSSPGGGAACFSSTNERLLRFSGLADF